jgi:hypothetical protein
MKMSACAVPPFFCESRPLQDANRSDLNSAKLIKACLGAGKPVGLVCHASGVLRRHSVH